jgi:hypothetical protein
MFQKATLGLVLFAVVGLWAMPAAAGLLYDGIQNDVYEGWSGSSPFQGEHETDLKGSIDWAVFAPEAFPYQGYAAPSGMYTYVYQVNCDLGGVPLSAFAVTLDGAADGIGSFTSTSPAVDGVVPDDSYIIPTLPGSANWNFYDYITSGSSSCGLVFYSRNPPMPNGAIVVNSGDYANLVTASPLPIPIPEPGTICLLACGLGLAVATRRLGRRWTA